MIRTRTPSKQEFEREPQRYSKGIKFKAKYKLILKKSSMKNACVYT